MLHNNAMMNLRGECMKPYDVIIVGSGIAGLRAGIECRSHGLSTLILEKMNKSGGNTWLSDGGIAAPETDLQKARGIEDSIEAMKADMLNAGKGLNDEALVDTITKHAKEGYEWTKSIGVPYMDRVDIFGGHSVPRCYTPQALSGRTMIKKAEETFLEMGGVLKTKTYVSDLLSDETMSITGVKAYHPYAFNKALPEKETLYKAKKGVILTSGGFGADTTFREKQDALLDASIDTTNIASATAEVLKSAIKHGADTKDLDRISLAPWTSPDEKGFGDGPKFADYIALQRGILVDPDTSKRFTNELADRKTISNAILKVGHPVIALADTRAVKEANMNLEKALKKGVVKTFEGLKSLSENYGLDAPSLEKTVTRFNDFVWHNEDKDYAKPLDDATPIETPPYYAMRVWPKVHYTMGGLSIDASARVLKKDGTPIPGLYAAGEVTGGVHGASRLGSLGLTDCLVMGQIAAQSIISQ